MYCLAELEAFQGGLSLQFQVYCTGREGTECLKKLCCYVTSSIGLTVHGLETK